MDMHVRSALLISLFLVAATASAQTDRILVPERPYLVEGAFGSQWLTELAIANVSDRPADISGIGYPCPIAAYCPPPPPIPARTTVFAYQTASCDEVHGSVLRVAHDRLTDYTLTSRVRDVSRQRDTWGTSIPVVGPKDLHGSRFNLVDVPVTAGFRSTLRLYDVDANTVAPIRLRMYAVRASIWGDPTGNAPDTLLVERTASLIVPRFGSGTEFCPGFFELSLSALPELAGAERVRIEIEPLDGRAEYWAYVSVTNNATQHVTVIVPQ